MRELSRYETGQVGGARATDDQATAAQLTSVNKNNQLVNKLFQVLNGLFGMKIPYLK